MLESGLYFKRNLQVNSSLFYAHLRCSVSKNQVWIDQFVYSKWAIITPSWFEAADFEFLSSEIWKNLPHGFDKSADLLSKHQNHEDDSC